MIELPKRIHEYVRQTTPELLPIRVYDLPCVDDRAQRLRASLPPATGLHVPVVSPDSELVSVLAAHASGFDAHRGADLLTVRRASPDTRISLRGPGKSGEEIRAALAAGAEIHADSPGELRLAGFAAEQAGRDLDVVLRVAAAEGGRAADGPTVPGSSSGERIAAGMDTAALVECAGILVSAAASRLRVRGFSVTAPPEDPEDLPRPADPDVPAPALPHAPEGSQRPADPGKSAALHRRARALIAALRPWSTMFGIGRPHYAVDADAPARQAWVGALLADSASAYGRASPGSHSENGRSAAHGAFRTPVESAADAAASIVRSYAAALAGVAAPHESIRLTSRAAVTGGAEWVLARVADIKHTGGRALALVDGADLLPDAAEPGTAVPGAVAVAPTDRTWPLPWRRPEISAEFVTVVCRDGAGQRVLVRDAAVEHLRVDDVLAFAVSPAPVPEALPTHCVQG